MRLALTCEHLWGEGLCDTTMPTRPRSAPFPLGRDSLNALGLNEIVKIMDTCKPVPTPLLCDLASRQGAPQAKTLGTRCVPVQAVEHQLCSQGSGWGWGAGKGRR